MKQFLQLLCACITVSASFAQTAFIENKGQVIDFNENLHPEVAFYTSINNASVYFHANKLVYNFKVDEHVDFSALQNDYEALNEAKKEQKTTYYRMDMEFVNASLHPEMIPLEQQEGLTHYYLNKRNGIRDVRSFSKVRYNNVYPAIDLLFYSSEKGFKYDIILNAGAKISDIKIKFNGANVQLIDKKLHIKTAINEMVEEIPLSFIDNDQNKEVDVEYIIHADNSIGFNLKSDISYQTLTIDPVLEWGSYFNRSAGTDNIYHIYNHLDNDGNFFTFGMAQNDANSYPVVNPGGAYSAAAAGSADAYLVKFNAQRQLVWSTYLGGTGYEEIYDGDLIKSHGNTLHIVGNRMTSGAPFTNGGGFFQSNANRNFWARFNKNTGVLEHLTSLSSGYYPSIAVSNNGTVVITNDVYDSSNLPIVNRPGAYNQATNGAFKDMGLMMFNPSYTQIWGTFWGGASSQENFMTAFDSNNNLYFVGETSNNSGLVNLPGAYNLNVFAGGTDVVLGKFSSTGQLVWATLFGGNSTDARRGQQGHGARIAVHPTTNELILAFNTTSNNLPLVTLAGAYNKGVPTHIDFGGSSGSYWNYAAYLCKFSTAGALNYGTYFYTATGGGDIIENIAFGACNKFYIGGAGEHTKTLTGASSGYNLTQISGSGRSGMITMLNSSNFAFEWDSYLNDNSSSEAHVAANVNLPQFYTMTTLYYQNLPLANPGSGAYYQSTSFSPTSNGNGISQFHPSLPPTVNGTGICSGASATLTASGGMGAPYQWYATATSSTILHTGASYTVSPTANTTYYVSSGSGICASPRVPVVVTVSGTLATPTLSTNGPLCVGATLNLFSTSSNIGVTYYWTGPNGFTSTLQNPTINNITTANTGTYTLYEIAGTCSSAAATITVTVNPIPAAPTISSNSPVCVGSTLNLQSNTYTGAVYYWSGPNSFASNFEDPSIPSVTSAAAGTYSVYVEQNSCTSATSTLNVVVNPTPATPTISSNSPICAGTTLQLSAPTVSGTYVWTGPNGFTSNLEDPTISNAQTNASGTYTLIIVQGACSSTAATTVVSVSAAPTTPVITSNSPLCSGSSILLNTATVLNATYVWTGPNGFTSSLEDPIIVNATSANSGTYNLTLVIGSCSSSTATHNITVNNAPSIATGTIVHPSACGNNNGSIQITGSASGTVHWIGTNSGSTPGATLPHTINNLPAGSYDVFIIPATGCTSNLINVTLVDPTPPATPVITANSPLCVGSAIQLNSNTINNATYVWSGPNGFTSNLEDPTISNAQTNASGSYSLYVVVAGCTSATANVPVVVNAIPTQPIIQSTSPACVGSPLTLSTNTVAGATYVWSGPNGFTSNNASHTFSSATSVLSGVYTLQIVVNGCTSNVATQNVVVNDIPTVSITASATNVCEGATVTLTGSGASNLSWNNGIQNGVPFLIFSTTTYTLTGVNASGCFATDSITINVSGNGALNLQITSNDADTTICGGQSIALSASGAGNYLWLHNNSASTTVIENPTQNTLYSVVGYVGNCNDTASIFVTVIDAPNYQIIASDTIVCPGSPVTLTAQGTGATVLWNTGETSASISVMPGIPTLYSFVATNAQNCSTSASIQLYPGVAPNLLLSDTTIVCGIGSSLDAGAGFSSYLWNTGATSQSISITSSNWYSVEVSNAQNCKATDSTYAKYSLFPADIGTNSNNEKPLCVGGVFTFQAFGGVSYEWNGPNNYYSDFAYNEILSVSAINEGEYIVSIYNADNCVYNDTVTLAIAPEKDCMEVTELVTPNNDGKNDALTFSYLAQYPNHKLSIYNRWGSLVYETSNYQNNWSGIANTGALVGKGELLPAATYFYLLDLGNGDKPVRGFVELQY